jgi:arylformamidase
MSAAIYTPEFVERQYNNRAAVPDFADWFAQWRDASRQTRESLPCELDVRYGRGPNETMDIFPAEDARGLFVFIHGGYWRSLDKSDFSFVASHFVGQGIGVAIVNYDLCPAVGIETICEQSRRALLWLGTEGRRHSLAPDRVVVGGHSAGGHLAAILFATDWDDTPVSGCIRGGVSVSGVFDLEPLVQFSYNSDLGLTEESARAVRVHTPVTALVGCVAAVPASRHAGAAGHSRTKPFQCRERPRRVDQPADVSRAAALRLTRLHSTRAV